MTGSFLEPESLFPMGFLVASPPVPLPKAEIALLVIPLALTRQEIDGFMLTFDRGFGFEDFFFSRPDFFFPQRRVLEPAAFGPDSRQFPHLLTSFDEFLPLQRPALIQNTTPTQNFGIPIFGLQNRPIKIPRSILG